VEELKKPLPVRVTAPSRIAETGRDVRLAARAGFTGLTVGRAPGFTQANIVMLPADLSAEFLAFCEANPVACPILGWGDPGAIDLPDLGVDIDLRTDLPRYTVHRQGKTVIVNDLHDAWRDDLVAVAIGCWFGAEAALNDAGVRLRHVELGIQGPLFRTNLPTVAVGRFHPNLVVSMRPFQIIDVPRVTEVTRRLTKSHGAPLHQGPASSLGIDNIEAPDWGEILLPEPGETALFWGCGLTANEALSSADIDFFITHAPGSMLVTDCREESAD
jgi:uncharacterized protein YcsI (UPF0317 family)